MTSKPTVCISVPKANSTCRRTVSLKIWFSATKRRIDTTYKHEELKTHVQQLSTLGFPESKRFLCHFQQECVQAIFLRRVDMHWHFLSWYDAGMVNAAGWIWQCSLHLPERWSSATLPPSQSAFAAMLDRTKAEDQAQLSWPPRSPYLMPCCLFL